MEPAPRRRALRSDAAANREALLVTAARVVRERGVAVPLTEVAAEAGVGIGTLYRHFPDREALLTALGRRAQEMVLEQARYAAGLVDSGRAPREAVAAFLDAVVVRRVELVLPSRPRGEGWTSILGALEPVVRRGVMAGDLRADATAADVLLAAVLLVPAERTDDARRHLAIHLDGLAITGRDGPSWSGRGYTGP